jgi:UDP-glucose 4-epimerase
MKALIIGGNGFIGSHLADRLLDDRWEVVVLDSSQRRYDPLPANIKFIQGDFGQPHLVREALLGVDIVFHLAWTTIHESSNLDPVLDITNNLVPTVRLLEACCLDKVNKIFFVSSGGTVYGPGSDLPIRESDPHNPVNSYGILKLTVEKYLNMFLHLRGLDYLIMRPSVPYGPRQNPLGRQGAANVFLYRVAKSIPITIWGDGTTTRDYFYISDLIDALVSGVSYNCATHRIFNIAGDQEITLINLVNQVERVIQKEATVLFKPARIFDVRRIKLDTSLSQRELNWSPEISLEQGLQQTWDWMKPEFF